MSGIEGALVLALVDAFLFLDHAGDNELDPDSAVRCMENISSHLLALPEDQQVEARRAMEAVAATQSEGAYRSFIEALPDMIGLMRRNS